MKHINKVLGEVAKRIGENEKGTPKTLIEAVDNGLQTQEKGIYFSTDPARITGHVRDYLSQKFSTALLKADGNPEAEKILTSLWNSITGEDLE